jgi:hypothetical protein
MMNVEIVGSFDSYPQRIDLQPWAFKWGLFNLGGLTPHLIVTFCIDGHCLALSLKHYPYEIV